jgi:hypothetical protein
LWSLLEQLMATKFTPEDQVNISSLSDQRSSSPSQTKKVKHSVIGHIDMADMKARHGKRKLAADTLRCPQP